MEIFIYFKNSDMFTFFLSFLQNKSLYSFCCNNFFYENMKNFMKKKKEEFYNDIIVDGFSIYNDVFWNKSNLFYGNFFGRANGKSDYEFNIFPFSGWNYEFTFKPESRNFNFRDYTVSPIFIKEKEEEKFGKIKCRGKALIKIFDHNQKEFYLFVRINICNDRIYMDDSDIYTIGNKELYYSKNLEELLHFGFEKEERKGIYNII